MGGRIDTNSAMRGFVDFIKTYSGKDGRTGKSVAGSPVAGNIVVRLTVRLQLQYRKYTVVALPVCIKNDLYEYITCHGTSVGFYIGDGTGISFFGRCGNMLFVCGMCDFRVV